MLSSTHTIQDVINQLRNDYVYFGYTNSALFIDDLTLVADDVYRTWFLPRIGSNNYNQIKSLDKSGLTVFQEFLYWAEVYTICLEFLRAKEAKAGALQLGSNETLRAEGYSYTISSAGGGGASSQNDRTTAYFYDKVFEYFKYAGFNINSIQRSSGIFGDGIDYIDLKDGILP